MDPIEERVVCYGLACKGMVYHAVSFCCEELLFLFREEWFLEDALYFVGGEFFLAVLVVSCVGDDGVQVPNSSTMATKAMYWRYVLRLVSQESSWGSKVPKPRQIALFTGERFRPLEAMSLRRDVQHGDVDQSCLIWRYSVSISWGDFTGPVRCGSLGGGGPLRVFLGLGNVHSWSEGGGSWSGPDIVDVV